MYKCCRYIVLLLLVVCGFCGKSQDSAAVATEDLPVIIADIQITGYKKTKPYIIEREFPFQVGDHILRSNLDAKLERCRSNIMNTSLFVEVNVTSKIQGELVFINIQVKERWYIFPIPYFKFVDRNINEWLVKYKGSLNRVNYGVKFMYNNVGGRNDKLNLWLLNGYSQQVLFRYDQPMADKSLKYGFDIGFAFSRTKEMNITTTADNKQQFYKEEDFINEYFNINSAITYRPAIKTKHYLRLGYTRSRITSDSFFTISPNYFGDGARSISYPEISYTINHFNVDYIPYPNKGFIFKGSFAKKGFNREMNVWQLNAVSSYTIPLKFKSALHLQAAGMLKLPFDQPFYNKRLFGYGEMYMRGLEYYVVDGVAGFIGRATLRKEVLNFNIKPPIVVKGHNKIPIRVLLKTYGDLGYAYDREPVGNLSNKLLKTYGIGVDVITFYDFIIRFEYSFNQLNNNGLFLHSKGDF